MFSIRVYGILINEKKQVLVSDELYVAVTIPSSPAADLNLVKEQEIA